MPGVREVLGALGADPDVVQTLVTGNVPAGRRGQGGRLRR